MIDDRGPLDLTYQIEDKDIKIKNLQGLNDIHRENGQRNEVCYFTYQRQFRKIGENGRQNRGRRCETCSRAWRHYTGKLVG